MSICVWVFTCLGLLPHGEFEEMIYFLYIYDFIFYINPFFLLKDVKERKKERAGREKETSKEIEVNFI